MVPPLVVSGRTAATAVAAPVCPAGPFFQRHPAAEHGSQERFDAVVGHGALLPVALAPPAF
jgi:hypothetical protein